jgi:hypothetical protein
MNVCLQCSLLVNEKIQSLKHMKVQDEKILKIEHKKYLQYINVIIKITTKTLIIKINHHCSSNHI